MTKIKICGIKTIEEIQYINRAMPDFVGFVFAKSKRQITLETALVLKKNLDNKIKSVGVFVNEDISNIKKLCDEQIIDIVQLHGDENNPYIKELKRNTNCPIIKAIRVQNNNIPSYDADFILFDSYNKDEYGGTGESFDWGIIKDFKLPFFLAGGLNHSNVEQAIKQASPYCVDVSSGVETNGKKSESKIIDIVNLVRSVE